MNSSNIYRKARFLAGAHNLKQLPPDEGWEVAFAGRSNAGKSSAINTITGTRSLARTSKTPGRTQQINFFALDEQRRLVDLPGYGYAKVPESVRRHWQQTLGRFLASRHALRGVVLVMDIRHPLTPYDSQMLAWCEEAGMAVHILLTKADKLKRGPSLEALAEVRKALAEMPKVSVQLFSALKGDGVKEVIGVLDRWLEMATRDPEGETAGPG